MAPREGGEFSARCPSVSTAYNGCPMSRLSYSCLPAMGLAMVLAGASGAQGTTVQRPSDPARTLVILGASYAKAWGTPALPGYARVINRGIGGEETGGMLKRLPADVIAVRPS